VYTRGDPMARTAPYRLCFLAALVTVTPNHCLNDAKEKPAITDKISDLRHCLRHASNDPMSRVARDQLVSLLIASNRYEEALQEYRQQMDLRRPNGETDLRFLELLLKTGRYGEVLRRTAKASHNHDLLLDEKVFECRVQAFLAQGQYREARRSLDQWLGMHGREGMEVSRFNADVQTLQQTRRWLYALEESQGDLGKALFTAAVPDSLAHWNHRHEVPVVFFKLVPAEPASQTATETSVITQASDAHLRALVDDMNRGFRYLSGDTFSLKLQGLESLYGNINDFPAPGVPASLLASRVYVHTIPPIYRLAGQAFVVLIDYRARSEEEAAYMGDGIIHIAANKLHTLTLMHEILHGLGATHQEWNALAQAGYVFDANDRGLMTFDKGELRDLGLEEKNRVLLDWPRVAVVHVETEATLLSTLNLLPTVALNH
jgi:hypothetical protein